MEQPYWYHQHGNQGQRWTVEYSHVIIGPEESEHKVFIMSEAFSWMDQNMTIESFCIGNNLLPYLEIDT